MLPHKEKLLKLKDNQKLPSHDKDRLESLINNQYKKYREQVEKVLSMEPENAIKKLCELANEYKFYLDFEFIFNSEEDFLYRQKGQLKIESSFLEELIMDTIKIAFPEELLQEFHIGPIRAFSHLYFKASLLEYGKGGKIEIKEKDQDVAVAKKLFIRTSFDKNFNLFEEVNSFLSFLCIECKTNLDKTMFQEAIATASDLKIAVPAAKYFLVCEWLDMTPISTQLTPIDEVIILRGKRLPQSVREHFASKEGRNRYRNHYKKFLENNPIRCDSLYRIYKHAESLLNSTKVDINEVLERGFF